MSQLSESYNHLTNELKDLIYLGNFIKRYLKDARYIEAYFWTALKLVFLKMYVYEVYTPIIKHNYKHMFYIDLFSGPGLNSFKEYPTVIFPGSPIIAWSFAWRYFDYMYFVDINQRNLDSLNKIFEVFEIYDKFKTINGDANKEHLKIIQEIEDIPSSHFLAFIDPFGFEIHWKTIERLLTSHVRGDFVILLQYQRVSQHVGNVLKGKNVKGLDLFFGTKDWIMDIKKLLNQGLSKPDAVIKYYKKRILSCYGRNRIVIEVNIKKTGKAKRYSLIFVTNKTISGNPWLERVEALKNLVGKDPKFIDSIIPVLTGKQKQILSYLG